jgi:chemotaxis signal transduction protein
MNRKIYKLQQIGDRLWILAANTAMVAALLGRDGRGLAIVAEETRNMTEKMQHMVERALFEDEVIETEKLKNSAQQIMLLALNAAIESNSLHEKGKQAAVCADEIRNLSSMLFSEISADKSLNKQPDIIAPWAKTPLTTISQYPTFILLKIGDIYIVENLLNVHEVFYGLPVNENGCLIIRDVELPVINIHKFLNSESEDTFFIALSAPWAEKSDKYAVIVDSVVFLFYSPVGKPITPPDDMPLAKYVRECWANENGEPFYFIDWTKMIN